MWSEGSGPRPGGIPRVGDTILGFKLVGELGRGAFARVFLAHQQSLGSRPVALKVTLRPTKEAERLAKLQHTNIVPVYSVHDEPPVQVICMPFLGRTTIADLIRDYRADNSSRQFSGRKTTTRAARTTTESGSISKTTATSATTVAPPNWIEENLPHFVGDSLAVMKVLGQLAAGLHHAHSRGVLHLDLKPANVLLADTGDPMLLDFNLSFDTTQPDREMIGGTIPYMAIEQLLDLRHRGRGVIDPRTDLYSLGVMAFEMLTATVPFPASAQEMRDVEALIALRRKGPPSIRAINPTVSPAEEAIVRKLLAPDPADRYQSAEQLRIDVERHFANLPLLYARETSLRERFGKWRKRNPGTPGRMLAACVVGLALGLGGVAHMRAEATARSEAVERVRVTRDALDTVRLDLILPDDPAARARGIARAKELLAAYGLPDDPNWQKRPEVQRLSESERSALAGDLGELLLLLAHARGVDATTRPETQRQEIASEALKLNRAAVGCFPEGQAPPLLERQAVSFVAFTGDTLPVSAPVANQLTTRDRFLDAVAAISDGRFSAAESMLKQVVAEQPGHAAAQFCLAFCRQQLGQYPESLERYDAARVLIPTDPRPAFQRGLVFGMQKKPDKAEIEFTLAIALDPSRGDFYRNRAVVRYRIAQNLIALGEPKAADAKLKEAEADFTLALDRGAPALHIHLLRALVRDARNDKAGADADRAITKTLTLEEESDFLVRGWTLMKQDPKAALADFKKAEELNPKSLPALQNQAHVLADLLKDQEAALTVVTRAVELYPEFAPAVAGRAVILARLGKRADAHREIEKARLLSSDPEITYQAACVYSLTSANTPEDREIALNLLRQALRDGYSDTKCLATDPDLGPLRGQYEFREIQRAATALFR
ncbi:MAG: protein kinase [Planctomycetia bacterium]|nr:protein kinase [Planctomycetia bacterium]